MESAEATVEAVASTATAHIDKIKAVRIATLAVVLLAVAYWIFSLATQDWINVAMSPVATSPAILLWMRVETGHL